MLDDGRPTGRGLARNLAVGLLASAAVVVGGRFAWLDVAPAPAILVGLVVAAGAWLSGWIENPAAAPPWRQPRPPAEQSRLAPDLRTRRTAAMLARSRPGEGFESTALSRRLAELAAQRLVRRRGLPSDDPLAHADGHLSAPLLTHLRAEHPPTVKRSTLHAYLKEIDEL